MTRDEKIKQFGRNLHQWLYDEHGGWPLLKDEGTWTAGGCYPLMEALEKWIGSENVERVIVEISTAPGIPQHVALRVHGWVIDGDGASRESTFVRRWNRETMHGIKLVPFDPRHEMGAKKHGMLCSWKMIHGIERAVREAFGSPKRWGLV